MNNSPKGDVERYLERAKANNGSLRYGEMEALILRYRIDAELTRAGMHQVGAGLKARVLLREPISEKDRLHLIYSGVRYLRRRGIRSLTKNHGATDDKQGKVVFIPHKEVSQWVF